MVGTAGKCVERSDDRMASARRLPERICSSTAGMFSMSAATTPPSRSTTAGPDPL
ncbi:Uncharacterised protein [Bordetella pertussis]|nr:Uncharacterised protein [Bordetella pertussis]